MHIIHTIEQLERNLEELERARSSSKAAAEYRALIKRGTCFLPYISSAGLSFAPSRFIGYVDNQLKKHTANPSKDGRITNSAINQLMGTAPCANSSLEQAYIDFCENIGVAPSKKGSFGVKRKYWITPEAITAIENKTEEQINQNTDLTATEKSQLIRARIGQGIFRTDLIRMWGQCSISGCDIIPILRASHIKPWRLSENAERLDKFNGLLLSPNLDALFDKGLISFTDHGDLLISNRLTEDALQSLGISRNSKIKLKPAHLKYMKWHRDNLFSDAISKPQK